jgi:hypothetical protein
MQQTQPDDWVECVRGGLAVWSNGADELIDKDTEDEDDGFDLALPEIAPSASVTL